MQGADSWRGKYQEKGRAIRWHAPTARANCLRFTTYARVRSRYRLEGLRHHCRFRRPGHSPDPSRDTAWSRMLRHRYSRPHIVHRTCSVCNHTHTCTCRERPPVLWRRGQRRSSRAGTRSPMQPRSCVSCQRSLQSTHCRCPPNRDRHGSSCYHCIRRGLSVKAKERQNFGDAGIQNPGMFGDIEIRNDSHRKLPSHLR